MADPPASVKNGGGAIFGEDALLPTGLRNFCTATAIDMADEAQLSPQPDRNIGRKRGARPRRFTAEKERHA